ncbi:SSI family serine proteinase inhibitor [Streptomyces sp. NPDC004126]|uniref:SSI family serine proteinase inhibitor n=1 Tax=Streptomyces sp. NPDC004126 TaxID=3390695 RepID=UPI003D07CAFF
MKKIALALGAVLATAAPAAALPAAATPPPPADAHVRLTVTRAVGGPGRNASVWLDCPARRAPHHPNREAACADLAAADGDLDRLPGQETAVCSNDSSQVTVTADGTYAGRAVHWRHVYANDCLLTLATGKVFDF